MAEIKDVYSLEFNSAQFQSEVDSAIGKIEELTDSVIEGQDVTNDLADAQAELTRTIGMEVKGVENLNAKRNVLVETQKRSNKETATGKIVSAELDKTNKQLAVSTGEVASKQKSLGAQLFDGARKLNSLRRAGMMLGNVFRLLGGINPFGLLLTAIPALISYITNATESQNAFNAAAESAIDTYAKEKVALDDLFTSLDDVSIKGDERSAIIKQINEQYGEYLPNLLTEKSTAEEIAAAYNLVNQALIQKAVTQAKTQALEEATAKLLKSEMSALKEIGKNEKLIADQRAKGIGKTSQGAKDAIKRNKQNIEDAKKAYQESLIVIEKASKDLEKTLGLNAENSGKRQVKIVRKTESELKDIYNKIKKEREDFDKMLIKEEKELRKNQKDEYLIEEEFFLNDLNSKYEKYLEEKTALDEAALEKRRLAEEKYNEEVSMERFQKEIEDLDSNFKVALQYREDNRNEQLAQDLLFLEQQRNLELASAKGNVDEQAKIDEKYNKKRKDIETRANIDILKLRIEFLEKIKEASQDFIDPGQLASLNKQIAELKLQLEEAGKGLTDGLEKIDPKDLVDKISQVITVISDSVFSVLNAQVEAYISQLDRAADKSKSTLDEIRGNSEDFNARQLEIEKQRLEKIEAERQRAVEREKALALVQLTVNSTLAIAKAAAEGGIAAPFTIASTIIALLAGFAQARLAASNAFYEGSEFVDRDMKYGAGRDKVPARLNRGERVITTDTNQRYWDVLSAVHNNKIPADVLNSFANGYQNGGLYNALKNIGGSEINLSNELGGKSFFVNVNSDNSNLENRLERIENVLSDLPKYMPKTTVTANANGIFKIVEQRQKRAKFINDRTK